MGKKTKDNIVAQAGILAIAGIISRIIGFAYRSPLQKIIGDTGNGYYASAFYIYQIVLLISSYSIPSAISKIIARRLELKEYKNAHKIFKCAFMYVLAVGSIGCAVLFFGANILARQEGAIPAIRIFAPTVLVYGPLGVLRGYFQAHKSMVQTSVSQIVEQIANVIASLCFANLFINMMGANTEDTIGIWGAAGSSVGTGIGVVAGLIVMFLIYMLNRKTFKRRVEKDKHLKEESYGAIFKEITLLVTPFILSTAIYNLSTVVNSQIYQGSYQWIPGVDKAEVNWLFGIFSGMSVIVATIPIAFASAMASAMIPSITSSVTNNDTEEAKGKIALAVKSTMIISIPSAVGLFVLAKPIIALIFYGASMEVVDIAGNILMVLAISVVFTALSTLNNSILQGIGRVNTPVVNAAIVLAVQTAMLAGLLYFTDLSIYAVAIANIVYAGLLSFLNQYFVRRAIGYKQEIIKTFVIPAVAALCMGAAAWVIYMAVFALVGSMKIAVIPAILVAVIVYFFALLFLKGVTEEELKSIPKGTAVIKLGKKIGAFK